MIMGVGVDLCRISRMEKILENEKFLMRFFAPEEQRYISEKGKSAAETAAGIFASKEALVKALGTGFAEGIELRDIAVLHDAFGAPYYELRNGAAQHASQKSITHFHLSISHDGDMAVAFAIAERG